MFYPFNPNQPADADSFANRREHLERIDQRIVPSFQRHSSGVRNLAIVGPPGIGKTSLANQLIVRCAAADPPVLVVYISASLGYGSFFAFCHALVTDAIAQVAAREGIGSRAREELQRWNFSLRLPGFSATRLTSTDPSPSSASELLRQEFSRLSRDYLKPHGLGMALILDDAHMLSVMEPHAMLILRAAFQDLHLMGGRIGLVITGPESFFAQMRANAEPASRFFEHIRLEPFALSDLDDVIDRPLQRAGMSEQFVVRSDARTWLMDKTRGHPFFVTFILQEWLDWSLRMEITQFDTVCAEETWPHVMRRLSQERFLADWETASEQERDVLCDIVDAESGLAASQAPHGNVLRRLVAKNLVERTRRGVYTVYHPLFGEFVSHIRQ